MSSVSGTAPTHGEGGNQGESAGSRGGDDQMRRLKLPVGKGAIGQCRAFTSEALAHWRPFAAVNGSAHGNPGRPSEPSSAQQLFLQDVLLMVSEVVTNACMHTVGPSELRLDRTSERLRIEVTDPSPQPPVPRNPTPGLPGGYGLQVVDRLSRAWGYAPDGDGKVVWFEMTWPEDCAG